MNSSPQRPKGAFATLRQFVRAKQPTERCELCSAPIGAEHQHLFEPAARRVLCSCDGCALLFDRQGNFKYRRIPRASYFLPDFQLSDAQWDALLIPISMAFFFQSTPSERVVAMYPSPAGATESLLTLDAWNSLVADNPLLSEMQPDVEALLVNRLGAMRGFPEPEYYQAPIDECYKLVGLLRTHWRGLSGGSEVWNQIHAYFADLKSRSSERRKPCPT
jgi:hypothetical protein